MLGEEFDRLITMVYKRYENLNVFVHRVKPYNEAGRFQTEEESDTLGNEMMQFLSNHCVDCLHITGDFAGYDTLTDTVLEFLNNGSTGKRYHRSTATKTIKIRYLSDEIEPLQYIDGKSDWIDLRAAKEVEMKQGDFKMIPLGVAMQLPIGYEAHMIPRSSTFKNFGIIQANHMGMIDESYCGDNDQWHFPAIAMRDTVIHVGDRICQFRIDKHQPTLVFQAVDSLGNANRGGFGTTGKR